MLIYFFGGSLVFLYITGVVSVQRFVLVLPAKRFDRPLIFLSLAAEVFLTNDHIYFLLHVQMS